MHTKTKNKKYLLLTALVFLSGFFVGIQEVKADAACLNECIAEADSDSEYCHNLCDGYSSDNNTQAAVDCGANASVGGDGQCYCNPGYGENDNGDCTFIDLNTEQCEADSDCVANIGEGYKCNDDGDCVPDSIFSSKECNDDADCVRIYGAGSVCSGFFAKTCEQGASVPTAADKKNAADLKAAAVTASNILNNAKKNKNAADSVLANCGQNCTQAQRDAANKANQDLVAAQAAFDEKIAVANEAYARAYPETASTTGAGFMLCANGAYAITCSADGGGGTPVVLGLGSGGGSFGGGFGNYGSGGKIGPKCGTDGNFQEIGGVCFPVNTGLSEAPITLILGNLFSWLMGLFTTFAVIAFVVSGIQYFMSSGDESMAEAAKDNAKNAAIGIVVGLSGFIIIKAIAAALSGQSYFF